MKKNQILVLAAIFSVLVLILVLSRLSGPEHKTRIEEDVLVEDFGVDFAGYIEFYHGDNPMEKVIIEKTEGAWVIPSKFDAKADIQRIENLVNDISGLKGEARVSNPALFGEFEIGENQAVHLLINDSGGTEIVHLLIGKTGPYRRTNFVRLAGENSIYPVNVPLLQRLGITRSNEGRVTGIVEDRWLDLRILPDFKAEDVTGIQLISQERKLSFRKLQQKEKGGKTEEGKWESTSENIPFDTQEDGVKNLLRGLAGRRAADVADPARMDEYGFETSLHTAVISTTGDDTIRIIVGNSFEENNSTRYYLKVGENRLPFIVEEYVVDRLFEEAKKLYKMTVIDIESEDAEEIGLKGQGYDLLLAIENNKWKISHTSFSFEERKGTAGRLADKILSLEPDDVLNLRKVEQELQSLYSIVLKGVEGVEQQIHFSGELENSNGERYCWISGRDLLFTIDKNSFNQLFPDISTLFDIVIGQIDRDLIEYIDIQGEGRDYLLRNEEKKWILDILGYRFEAYDKKVGELIEKFTSIKPTSVIITNELSKYGLEEPLLAIELKGPERAVSIRIGKEDKRGANHYAIESENGLIFKISKSAVTSANTRPSYIANLRVFPPVDTLTSIKMKGSEDFNVPTKSFSFIRKEIGEEGNETGVWKDSQNNLVDKRRMKILISRINSLMASDIVEEMSQDAGDENRAYIELETDEKNYVLFLLSRDKKENLVICRMKDTEGFLKIRESQLERIFREAAVICKIIKESRPEQNTEEKDISEKSENEGK